MTRVLSVSSSRADVTILRSVWQALAARHDCEPHVLLTGMHQTATAAGIGSLPANITVHRGGTDLGGRGGAEAAAAMADITRDAARLMADIRPDVVLLVGDRLDMIPAALAALPFNLPLAHLHGGEITEGAVDDRLRHALTKLSHIHLAASADAAKRIAAMGEEARRIHLTGAPALDTLLATPPLSASDFARQAGLAQMEGDPATLRLVTVHPETNAADPSAPLTAVLDALDAMPLPTVLTAPNSDPGGEAMRRRIEAFVDMRPWTVFVDTLGELYAQALRHAAMMIGNSSSGIIEAGLFGLPVINVGDRQRGRERGGNVTDVPNDAQAVRAAMSALGPRPPRFEAFSPYGDGKAAARIAEVLTTLPPRERLLVKTGFIQ